MKRASAMNLEQVEEELARLNKAEELMRLAGKMLTFGGRRYLQLMARRSFLKDRSLEAWSDVILNSRTSGHRNPPEDIAHCSRKKVGDQAE